MNKRIDIIDSLRGFALAGIVVVHIVEQYVGAILPPETMESARVGVPDYIVDVFINIFLRGKFFALFSILFGLSFYILFNNAKQRGIDYKGRYLWRIFLLFVIGYIHHAFYRGDILTIYAILAPFLLFFLPLSNRGIWIGIAIVLLGIPRNITFYLCGDLTVFGHPNVSAESVRIAEYWEILKYGSLPALRWSNITDGFVMKMEFQLGLFYRFYLTFAFFLMGIWLGRIQFFQKLEEYRKSLKKAMWYSGGGLILFGALTAVFFSQMGEEFSFANPWVALGLHMADMFNICLTILILGTFVLMYKSEKWRKRLDVFKEYGKTALTNYVTQTLIGTSLLMGWGLGLIGEYRNAYLFVLSIVIIMIQIIISKWWMKRFRYGPLEWLWRSATYMKKM